MSRPVEHAYIPEDLIEKAWEPKEQPDTLEIVKSKTPLYTEFAVLGDTTPPANLNEAFNIEMIPDGTLYVSKRNYVEDLEGNKVPRTMLITAKGKEIFRQNPGLLKAIDKGLIDERDSQVETMWTKKSRSGKVGIIDLDNGDSVAVKRFKRYKDGRKLHVGGLEQAEAHMRINEAIESESSQNISFRMADIYLATQDLVIMENIEGLTTIDEFIEKYPELEETISKAGERIDAVIYKTFTEKNIKGIYENLSYTDPGSVTGHKPVLRKHLFIENYDPETGKIDFVMIDPNI
ncbi:hypothetical protein A3F07_01340 [candidate division WWE3 bacterium RIFCSPHIGHO2_12_FULL_38_15]|uniref:Uncharacterized protein n=1 Tax=candidate division WWE3 bacterium RIFCSPHIGHO2_02_FULL_38_14 TaxID=1802620 RepID=A0A1F4V8T9_UNCKA|nr:MAG: hypothetical protein A2793_01955 [candidate division WWE3 bacterium RIFCSPHIGHO2_01_FULL_38_45]OGC48351.1 MAG: hypothetical protein A3F07_01340 [candidate division WWE3 bacterium RIFCSPHIGHO2_12_FULL_38_15]OGC53671.1 MAG: hypothetical protein A3D91_04510 [candidate division WWE3 bacterium RIFCSPHIGHO2_02_FULL_38_14]OGC54286.1 MAG: hypothetical protein A3B64_02140 [candidate division WWE3 bacterium RIFCSPLOWO2_01_FULL_37_24]HLB51530.1 hypothetical protein [Patescibacteria group bacterium